MARAARAPGRAPRNRRSGGRAAPARASPGRTQRGDPRNAGVEARTSVPASSGAPAHGRAGDGVRRQGAERRVTRGARNRERRRRSRGHGATCRHGATQSTIPNPRLRRLLKVMRMRTATVRAGARRGGELGHRRAASRNMEHAAGGSMERTAHKTREKETTQTQTHGPTKAIMVLLSCPCHMGRCVCRISASLPWWARASSPAPPRSSSSRSWQGARAPRQTGRRATHGQRRW